MDKEDLKYIEAGILGCSESELTEDLSQEVDSEGNPLTKEQVEFFRNSKIRDNRGRLLVCYHGSKSHFTTFDKSKIKSGGWYGKGFYFTRSQEIADYYSEGHIITCYLNITNPFYADSSFTSKEEYHNRCNKLCELIGLTMEEIDKRDEECKYIGDPYYKVLLYLEHTKSTKDINDYVKELGYDGVIGLSPEDDSLEEFIILEPNQVKSIDNQTPSNKDDINEVLQEDLYGKDKAQHDYGQAYSSLIDNNKTRLYRYREWANNSNNDYKEYIYNDLKKNKDKSLRIWYNHYKLFNGKYDLSYDDFLNTPITLYRATNVNEKDDATNPFFSYAQSKKLAQRFLDPSQRLHNKRTGEIEAIQIKPKDTLGMIPSDENEIIVPNKAYQSRVNDMSSIVDNVIKYANENNVKLPYNRDYILTLFNKRDKENVKKLEAQLMNYIDKRKGNKVNESVDSKTFTFPNLRQAIDFFWKDRNVKIETVPIKKLVDDNDLLNDWDLQSYHQRQWDNKKASEFSIDKGRVNSMRISEVPYAVRKKDGRLELGDGRHRTRALYNDGYEYVTLPVITESKLNENKTTPRIRESLLQEGKQDKENFKKWIENNDGSPARYMSSGNKEAYVNSWVTWFNSIRQNLKSPYNDFYYWIKLNDWDAFTKFMQEQRNKEDAKQREKDGARLIYSDNDWKVYEITTYEASVKYGANTKWCISGSKRWSNGENGKGYWDDYTSKGVKFYFFINKDTKYAIAIYPNGTDFEIFDAQDNSIAYIPNAPIIDEIKVDYYSQNEDRLMLNLVKTGQLPHVCSILSSYLWKCDYYTDIYTKNDFDAFLQQIEENVNADYVKWLAVYDGLKDEEWYKQETGEEYEDEWMGDTTNYIYINFLDGYATLDDALTKDNPKFYYDESEYFINDLYECDILCCKDWVGVWLHIDKYIKDETDLINFIKKDIRDNWNYEDFEKVGLSKEYLLDIEDEEDDDLDEPFVPDIELEEESLEDFDDEVGLVYHGGIEKSLHKDFRSILWFTEDYDYALDFGENIFICNLNLKNTFIVGNTDGYIRGLIPTQFSTDFTRLANNLKVTPKELLKCNPEAKNIYSIVRTKAFKELCIKNGYDSVETEEFGHVCFGVFNLDQVDIVDTDFEDESTLETLSPMDESLTPRVREELLLEKGTDYKKQAIKIISNSGLFDEETSTKIIEGLFRQDIHAFNHAPAWLEKYLKGIARMLVEYCDGDSSKAQQFLLDNVSVFEYYLNWVKANREKVGNQLDDEFINKLSIEELNDKVNKMQEEQDKKSQDELSKMNFDNKSNYTLVPINSFEEFNSKYGGRATGDGSSDKYAGGGGTAWCHANNKDTYDGWVNKGKNKFFVLQRNDWKEIPFNEESNERLKGKDDYGNSLIAINTNRYGKLKYATLRCNHVGVDTNADKQYETYAELSKLAGFNVEEEVKKYCEEPNNRELPEGFYIDNGTLYSEDDATDVESFVIPNDVISIGYAAFRNCTSLTSVTIPNSVKEIGAGAFYNCKELKSIIIPDSVTSIGDSAFHSCSSLTSIKLSNNLASIDIGTFCNCTSLKSIEIPNSVKEIGYSAFCNCTSLTSIEIPNGIKVIDATLFSDCSSLVSVILPKSVTRIEYGAFTDCESLKSITIPNDVTSIGMSAFENCYSLTSVTLPNSLEIIHSSAFSECTSLTHITIPNSVTRLGNGVFDGCRSLTNIEIPNSVKEIGYNNFEDCSPNLTVLTDNEYVMNYCYYNNIKYAPLNESLKEHNNKPNIIEDLLLEKGTDYRKQAIKIIVDSGLFSEDTATKIIDGLFRQDIHAFNHAPAWLEKYLKGIARMMVEYCNGDKSKAQSFLTECPSEFEYYLTWVKQNREKIGNSLDDEFVNNLTYEQVKEKNNKIRDEIDAKSKDELSKMKFSDSSNYTLVPIDSYEQMHKLYGGHWTGDGTDKDGEYAGHNGTSWCHTNSKNTYDNWTTGGYRFFVLQRNDWKNIPFNEKTNEEMGGKDEYGNSLIAILVNNFGRLDNATLRCNHVGVVGSADNQYDSYADLSKVVGFNVEEEVLKHGFEEFSVDKLFTVKGGVLMRANDDWDIYEGIVKYAIPEGTRVISNCAFYGCSSLESITIPNSITEIDYEAFYGCSSLTSVNIPESVTEIGDYAFKNCNSLKSIIISKGVTRIGFKAFSDCSELTSVTLPNGITSIEGCTFAGCEQLTSIKIPSSVEDIDYKAFSGCAKLTNIEIPDGVIYIGEGAFEYCSSLMSITIPNSVINIENYAFPQRLNLTVFTDNEYVIRYCNKYNIKYASLSEYHKS